MKKLILIFAICLLSSCGDAMDKEKCLSSVTATFPNSEIYSINGTVTEFVVIDSTGVKLVKTESTVSADITSVDVLMKNKI